MIDPETSSQPQPPASGGSQAVPSADAPTPKKQGPPKKIQRTQIAVNVVVQVAILLTILLMCNYLGFRHYERWDFSRNQRYTLAPRTLQILDSLKEPIDIIVWFDEASDIYPDLSSLLTEYQIRGKGKIQIEYVDILRNPTRTRELYAKYKFKDNENVVILDNGRNSKFVYGADMVQYAPVDPLLAQVQSKPEVQSFSGEQRISSAMAEVLNPDRPKVYFTQGHREPEFVNTAEAPSPFAMIQDYLAKENVELAPIMLINLEQVPEDADALVIMAPQYDFTQSEQAMLEEYWERGGRIIMFLDPNFKSSRNLVEFSAKRGIVPRRDRVLRTASLAQGVTGMLVDVPAKFTSESPITDALGRTDITLLGGTQSLELDERVARQLELTIARLIIAEEGYWGETEYPPPAGGGVAYDKGLDAEAPLVLAASVEQLTGGVTRRLVVVGNGAMVEDRNITTFKNVDFMMGAMNWVLDRQELIGIVPKDRSNYRINLTDTQKANIKLLCIFVVPFLAALIGFIVWLRRRK